MRSVQCRTYQFRKSGIHYGELLDGSLLYVQHFGDKSSALCNNGAAQLKVELLSGTQFEFVAEYVKVLPEVWNGILFGIDVIYTQTTD